MTGMAARSFLFRLVSVALVSASFAQISWAGVIGTDYVVDSDARSASLTRIDALLARADVAEQLADLGVARADIDARLQGLTSAELLALEGQIEEQVAGGDALGVIGAVFLVLIILELVGITDIFKGT